MQTLINTVNIVQYIQSLAHHNVMTSNKYRQTKTMKVADY